VSAYVPGVRPTYSYAPHAVVIRAVRSIIHVCVRACVEARNKTHDVFPIESLSARVGRFLVHGSVYLVPSSVVALLDACFLSFSPSEVVCQELGLFFFFFRSRARSQRRQIGVTITFGNRGRKTGKIGGDVDTSFSRSRRAIRERTHSNDIYRSPLASTLPASLSIVSSVVLGHEK